MLTTAPRSKIPVDNQCKVETKITARQKSLLGVASLLGVIIIILLLIFNLFSPIADPYIQEVLALNGVQERGHAIFEINCAACHGFQANGLVGPSLKEVSKRKSKVSLIHQVISGETPPMPKFQPTTQDMADLLSYLETL